MSNKNKVLKKSEYIAEKLTILRQLGIYPNYKELEKLHKCKTEIAIDNYVHSLIVNKL